jgi:hypothetical protein
LRKRLTWTLGLLTSLAGLPILMPFCARDACYDRGGAVDAGGKACRFGPDRVEPIRPWSWPIHGWVYFLVIGALPGLAIGAIASHLLEKRNTRNAAA